MMGDLLVNKGGEIEKLTTLLYLELQERKKLSSELHKSKSAIHLAIMIIGKLKKTATCEKELELLNELLNNYVTEFRETYYKLNPPFVEDLGLQKALIILAKNYSEKEGLEVTFSVNQLEKINDFTFKQIAVFKTLENIIELCKIIGARKTNFDMKLNEDILEVTILNFNVEGKNEQLGAELLSLIKCQLIWIKAKICFECDWKNRITFKVNLSEV